MIHFAGKGANLYMDNVEAAQPRLQWYADLAHPNISDWAKRVLELLQVGSASSLSDLQRKNLIIEDKKFAPKKLKLFNFNRLPHQVRQAARQDV